MTVWQYVCTTQHGVWIAMAGSCFHWGHLVVMHTMVEVLMVGDHT